MTPSSTRLAPDERRRTPGAIRRMFEAVAPGYDRMNRLLSFGLDQGWRRAALRDLKVKPNARILDLCCGTGDLGLALPRGPLRVGCDFTPAMLEIAARKARTGRVAFPVVAGDAMRLPFRPESFDRLIVGFGARNLSDLRAAFREMHRVLRPGGRVVILEFSQPTGRFARWGNRLWLRTGVPWLARLLAPGPGAYGYLRDSVLEFPEPEAIARTLASGGFERVSWRPLWFGTVAIHSGRAVTEGHPGSDRGTGAAPPAAPRRAPPSAASLPPTAAGRPRPPRPGARRAE